MDLKHMRNSVIPRAGQESVSEGGNDSIKCIWESCAKWEMNAFGVFVKCSIRGSAGFHDINALQSQKAFMISLEQG